MNRRRHGDESEYIKEYSVQTHLGAFLSSSGEEGLTPLARFVPAGKTAQAFYFSSLSGIAPGKTVAP